MTLCFFATPFRTSKFSGIVMEILRYYRYSLKLNKMIYLGPSQEFVGVDKKERGTYHQSQINNNSRR